MIPGPMLAKNLGRDQLMPEMFRIALAAINTSSKVPQKFVIPTYGFSAIIDAILVAVNVPTGQDDELIS